MKEAVVLVVIHLVILLLAAAIAAGLDDLWQLMTWRYVLDELPRWVLT